VSFLNVGSVGKPKDGDWRACYAVFDTATLDVQFVRVAYDIATVTDAIRKSELPAEFAVDLEQAGGH
jgi:diadenosine tetraphosphatase ApaH/serine/threonine PP2A family protein phosphatase